MSTAVVSVVLGGPIDWDLGSLVPDLLKLVLIFLGAMVALLVTSAVLLAGVTVGLTYLRRGRTPASADDPDDEV